MIQRWVHQGLRLIGWLGMAWAILSLLRLAPLILAFLAGFMIFPGSLIVIVNAIHERSIKIFFLNILTMYLYLPMMMAGLLMPVLALGLMAEVLLPGVLEINSDILRDGEPPFIDKLLVFAACLAIVGLAWILIREALWLSRKLRLIENLATSKIGSAALGLVELSGVYRPAPEGAAATQKVEFWSTQLAQPFCLEDATGKIRVDPRRPSTTRSLLTGLFQLEMNETDLRQLTVKDGDPLYIIGTLEPDETKVGVGGLEALVVRRRSRPTSQFMDRWTDLRTAFLGGGEKAGDEGDLLFITDGTETAARARIRSFRRGMILRVALLIGLCLWMVITRLDYIFPTHLPLPLPTNVVARLSFEQRQFVQYCYHPNPHYRRWAAKHLGSQSLPHRVTVMVFLEMTGSGEAYQRDIAVGWLAGNLRTEDFEFHPQLAAFCRHPQPELRRMGAKGLAAVQAPWISAGPSLLVTLKDPDPMVRLETAMALGSFAPEAVEAMEPLAQALVDSDGYVSHQAGEALKKFGPAARPVLVAVLRSGPNVAAAKAAFFATFLGPPEADVAALRAGLADSRPQVRTCLLQMLTWRRVAGEREAEPELRAAVKHTDPETAAAALLAIVHLEWMELREEELPAVLAAFRSPRYNVRQAAGTLAARTPAFQARLLPTLMECVKDTDSGVACDAMNSLKPFGIAALPALPALTTALKDAGRFRAAAQAIGNLGPPAASPEVFAALRIAQTQDSWNRSDAVLALLRLQDVECVRENLRDPLPPDAYTVLNHLGEIGSAARWALPVLLAALRDHPRSDTAGSIARILINIGTPAREALPLLKELLTTVENNDNGFLYREAELVLSAPEPPADLETLRAGPPRIHWPFAASAADLTGAYPPAETVEPKRFKVVAGRAGVYLASGDTLTYSFEPAVDLEQGYSLEWWMKGSRVSTGYSGELVNSELWSFRVDAYQWFWYRKWSNEMGDTYRRPRLKPTSWVHYAVVYDPYRCRQTFYEQGEKIFDLQTYRLGWTRIGDTPTWDDSRPVTRLKKLRIGDALQAGVTARWQGRIADLRLYDFPRTPEQIAAAGKSAPAPPVDGEDELEEDRP